MEEEKQYKCSKCKETKKRSEFHESPQKTENGRDVTSWCKICRKSRDRWQENYRNKLKKHGQLCSECQQPQKIVMYNRCKECLARKGFKQCKKCKHLLFLKLHFYEKRSICKNCYAKKTSRRTNQKV